MRMVTEELVTVIEETTPGRMHANKSKSCSILIKSPPLRRTPESANRRRSRPRTYPRRSRNYILRQKSAKVKQKLAQSCAGFSVFEEGAARRGERRKRRQVWRW